MSLWATALDVGAAWLCSVGCADAQNAQLRSGLLASDLLASLQGRTVTGGRLDLERTLGAVA